MMKFFKLHVVLIAFIALLLTGCSSQGDSFSRSNDYERVVLHDETLILPNDFDGNILEDRYPIPKIHDRGSIEQRYTYTHVSPPRTEK